MLRDIAEIDLQQLNAGALWISLKLHDGRVVRVDAVIRAGVLDVSYEVAEK